MPESTTTPEPVFTFPCPNCNNPLSAKERSVGKTKECPVCHASFAVPPRIDATPPPPTEPTVTEPNEPEPIAPQLSRAVYIFLAVFVGIFGVHDFYAKRVRAGWIHLALLLPWILVILVSILGVFGYTLYALSYSPLRREIRETQRALQDGEKEIRDGGRKVRDCMRDIEEKQLELAEAQAGKKRITPQQDQQGQRRVIVPRPDQPEPGKEIIPKPDQPEPQEEIAPKPEPEKEVVIDEEYVRDLLRELAELDRLLEDLEQQLLRLKRSQQELEDQLAGLRTLRGAQQFEAWLGPGPFPLWFYVFFVVLPFASWVMAMVEIIYVTRDSAGRQLNY